MQDNAEKRRRRAHVEGLPAEHADCDVAGDENGTDPVQQGGGTEVDGAGNEATCQNIGNRGARLGGAHHAVREYSEGEVETGHEEASMRIGFIGLGLMGAGMATRLIRAGHELTVFNRTPQKADPLIALGAKRAQRVGDACKGDVVFTMLADDHALEGVAFGNDGLVQHMPAGAIHVSCSTLSVEMAQKVAAAHAKARQVFVSAVVFGRPEAAAAGKLFVLAAGETGAVERVKPLLAEMGQSVTVLSERPADANLLKLGGNFLIASMIEALGEALALVEKEVSTRDSAWTFSPPPYSTFPSTRTTAR